ncbi:lipopolysaccharide assembly protein LapB [Cesiribacter sp. SM1]|uniref:type IX secretion system periplasmic lipoprotein PorW/SprE n=1 Tax=Cesiribacter sp. SM1 TaxID=2861196 RepID=UPI001CD498CF|nr:methyltransferase [Cesiribacter sp. SM1]
MSKNWHNTTAHYNAYFLADQKLKEIEQQIEDAHQRNFNDLLYIEPPLDTIMAQQYAEPLEEAMKMASLAIERHKNSKWVDDSYLLVGKARFYGRELEHAIETFKYVNTKSKDDNVRHKALIHLMHTFMDDTALNNAKGVADFLRKENLNKENTRDYNLALASLYRHRQEWDQMAAVLENAVADTKKKDGRAKLHFILGQLYQRMENQEEAYKNFRQVLRSNPDYELSFFARLHMAQVANLTEEGDEKQIRRYFSKLLRDRKNKEYRDKIYYEMGNFEMRHGNIKEAIDNYKKSVAVSTNNPRQKSYAYRKLAEFYYTEGRYKLSKAYYDSTATTTPQDETDYAFLQNRQRIMADLVEQITVIEQQDSLLRLASMDPAALDAYIEDVVKQEEQARELALRKGAEKINQVNVRTGFNTIQDKFGTTQEDGSGVWYFYNTSLVSIGQTEFVKRWGNRPLEDNWRRSDRGRESTGVTTQAQAREEFEDLAEDAISNEERIAARRSQMIENLPMAPEQQAEARLQIETAYYNLGRILNYDLKEFLPTVDAYTTLLSRFQESEYRPEVLYNLYLLYLPSDEAKAAQYRDELIRMYPESTFARTLINPNYQREEDQATAQLKQLYSRAYSLYQRQAYARADSVLAQGQQLYPNNTFQSHLDLLRILIMGQTDDVQRYQSSLEQFIQANENEELDRYATELLQASHKFSADSTLSQGTVYEENFNQPHYFIALYNSGQTKANELIRIIDQYNAKQEAGRRLKATTIILNDRKSMVFVSQFPDKTAAMQYFRALERKTPFGSDFENADLEYFVISKDNFGILYNTKDVGRYSAFFQKFYY